MARSPLQMGLIRELRAQVKAAVRRVGHATNASKKRDAHPTLHGVVYAILACTSVKTKPAGPNTCDKCKLIRRLKWKFRVVFFG